MAPSLHSPLSVPEGTVTAAFLADPPRQAHSVYFYEEPTTLFEIVARFVSGGLGSGDRVLVIVTAAHRDGVLARLDPSLVAQASSTKHLVILDAHETLAKITSGATIDRDLFDTTLDHLVAELCDGAPNTRIRAYGEMVDVLWRSGEADAALGLEDLWREANQRHPFTVLCAYAMGHFYDEADAERGRARVCDRHTHVIRGVRATSSSAPESFPAARDDESLEERVRSLEAELRHRKGLEAALRHALQDRSRVEVKLRESVRREREARRRAEENDAFKEQFLAILGHDLRNPLSTILTTSRLMVMRDELSPDSARRLGRVIVSGVRMQRMIEQILDVTSDRLDDGIHVAPEPEQDVAALARAVVDELRAANPGRAIEVAVDGSCVASVDGARVEQVLKNLLGNALTHGDAERPARLRVASCQQGLILEIHNFGPPIDDEERGFLFEPFKRSRKSKGRSEGLGLGLYISRRIVTAHGGSLDVDSSADRGTTFRVTLPRARR